LDPGRKGPDKINAAHFILFPLAGRRVSSIITVPRLLLAATILSIASFLAVKIWDGDIFWLVGIGRYILEHRTVPGTNLFSLADYGLPYHDSHWLFQVVMALADGVMGMTGVHLAMIVLWAAVFLVSYRSLRAWLWASSSLVILLAMAKGKAAARTEMPSSRRALPKR